MYRCDVGEVEFRFCHIDWIKENYLLLLSQFFLPVEELLFFSPPWLGQPLQKSIA